MGLSVAGRPSAPSSDADIILSPAVTGRNSLPGQGLVPLVTGGTVAEDHVFIEWPAPPTRTVVSPDGWNPWLRAGEKCQRFNLNHDPGECANLFDSGRHRDVIQRLTERIHAWQETVRDPVEI